MAKRKLFLMILLTSLFVVNLPLTGLTASDASKAKQDDSVQSTNDDNTKINKRDTSNKELTADQQSQTKGDREIAQNIRRAVVDDKSLSTNAHNVKIIVVNGMVTLKGPVKSEEEKLKIEEKASRIAGKGKFKNEIDIAL